MIYTSKEVDIIFEECVNYVIQQSFCEWDSAVPIYADELADYLVIKPQERFRFIVCSDIFHDACGKIIGYEEDDNGTLLSVTVTTDY